MQYSNEAHIKKNYHNESIICNCSRDVDIWVFYAFKNSSNARIFFFFFKPEGWKTIYPDSVGLKV